MSLTLPQRRARLKVRIAELTWWRDRQSVTIDGWTIDGEPIALGGAWPSREGAHRFAADVTVPADWPLAEVCLRLDVGGESLVTLDDGSGAAASFGLDPYHREFPVRAHRFAVTTESTARLPFGQPVRQPRLTEARVVWTDPAVRDLHLLLTQVLEAADILGDHEAVPHLVALGEAALRALDWPSATPDYVARTAPAPGQQSIWELPELTAAPSALNQAERAKVREVHDEAVAGLRRLRERFPPQGRLAVVGHAHIDLAWLWPYAETRRKMRRTFHAAANLMDASADFRFNQSTAHYYWQVGEDDPALLGRIKEKVAAGQWEVLGGMWVEPDTNMPTGESLARQILYGQRFFEKTFGRRHDLCWLPDCFGFSGALPQLLRQGGMRSFFTIKVNWSETNTFPADLFWWEGLDGSRVLAHTFDNPVGGYNGDLRPDCTVQTWANFRGKTVHDTSLLAVGYGDGGGGVTPEMIRREVQMRDFPALPAVTWTTVTDFFAGAHATAETARLPIWAGEIYLELHRATLTTQSHTKRLHRHAERALITAETVASLGHLFGGPAPATLEPAWRTVLKNEFHDILPGSSIREVYQDAERELGDALALGLASQQAGLETLAGLLPEGPVVGGLMIVNPGLAPRTLRVTLADGTVLASNQVVPPLSVRVIDRGDIQPGSELTVSPTRIENAHLAVTIGADGTVTSLIHKATGRQALAGPANQLWAYPQDKTRNWDAWDVEEDYAERGEQLVRADSIEVVASDRHRAAVKVVRTFRHSTVTQVLSLTASSRRLDIDTEIDWHDRRVLLRMLNPVAVKADAATFECAFGVVSRSTHDNTSWDQAKFEVPGHRFVDLSEPGFGVALLNTAKYGHSAKANVLGLSLVRGPIYPDPLADEGLQRFTVALYPHVGTWHDGGVREEAEDLNQPLLVCEANGRSAGTWTPLAIDGIPAALAGLKPAEDGNGLILRIYEPSGGRGRLDVSVPGGWQISGPLSILEEPMARTHEVDLMPFEVRNWRLSKG